MAPENLLSTIRGEIDARLADLRPLLAEHEQLLAAAAALDAPAQPTHAPASPRDSRATARPRVSRARAVRAELSKQARSAAAEPAPSKRTSTRRARSKQPRAVRGAAREAILGALYHGSHTVAELSVVTAMSGPNIRNNLNRLLAEGAVAKTEREGKLAYALPG
jgi:phage-related tail fiber protein